MVFVEVNIPSVPNVKVKLALILALWLKTTSPSPIYIDILPLFADMDEIVNFPLEEIQTIAPSSKVAPLPLVILTFPVTLVIPVWKV